MITVGFASTRTGRKAHRHCNGYAFCGAGKLIGAPREIADGDQMCRRCANWLTSQLAFEIDSLDRRMHAAAWRSSRPAIQQQLIRLNRFVESGRTIDDIHAEAIELDGMRSILAARFDAMEAAVDAQFARRPVADYAIAGRLF